VLVARDIQLQYRDGSGLRRASISIERGSASVLMGPSGSGKTTLLRALCLLETPQLGSMSIDETHLTFPAAANRNPVLPYPLVTLVFQQLFLWPHLTNEANVVLALKHEDQHREFQRLANELELHPFLDKYPNQSSLGQRQRVAIARALALLPGYLLLDEVTSALDHRLAARVTEVLNDAKRRGVGLLVVTHDIGVADRIADRFYRIENGEVQEASRNEL